MDPDGYRLTVCRHGKWERASKSPHGTPWVDMRHGVFFWTPRQSCLFPCAPPGTTKREGGISRDAFLHVLCGLPSKHLDPALGQALFDAVRGGRPEDEVALGDVIVAKVGVGSGLVVGLDRVPPTSPFLCPWVTH
jgi:hypothetical protein